jgi:hypothetical protein
LKAARSAPGKARTHLAAAKRLGKNDPQRGFRDALAGWRLVAPHAEYDETCRSLTEALEKELRVFGEAANKKSSPVDRFKTLITE